MSGGREESVTFPLAPIGVVRSSRIDAIEASPIVDVKPVMKEFLPRGEVSQPKWATELMASYWSQA